MFNLYIFKTIFISLFIISRINSQEPTSNTDENINKIYTFALTKFNQTNSVYNKIAERMKEIKFNLMLKFYYRDLKKIYNKINTKISKIEIELNKDNIEEKQIIGEIEELNQIINNFNKKCLKMEDHFNGYEKTGKIIISILKIFFFSILIIAGIIILIIAVISIYLLKKREYHKLVEEQIQIEKSTNKDGEINKNKEKEKNNIDEKNNNNSKKENLETSKRLSSNFEDEINVKASSDRYLNQQNDDNKSKE